MTTSLSDSLITLKSIELEKSLFFTYQILGLLANTLAANEKYPVLNRDNLTMPIEMQLSQKHQTFSIFFAKFFKYTKNLNYFQKKDGPHRCCISENTDS